MMARVFGWFKELPDAMVDSPSIELFRTAEPLEEAPAIVDYLASGQVVAAGIGDMAIDVLGDAHREICPPAIMSDGVWVWPNHLAYYVAVYGVRPPIEFIEHMRQNGWVVPSLDSATVDRLVDELFGKQE